MTTRKKRVLFNKKYKLPLEPTDPIKRKILEEKRRKLTEKERQWWCKYLELIGEALYLEEHPWLNCLDKIDPL